VKDPLVWIDLEMTGLDPERDAILEVAVVVTDGSLDEVIEGPDLVLSANDQQLKGMDPIVQKMHEASGLADEAGKSSLTASEAEARVLDFVMQRVPEPGTAPLAGNSVHVDRAFLHRYMPRLEAWLHYRNVDVSTVKELLRRWDPESYGRMPQKEGAHRALGDVLESIEELRSYRKLLFPEPVRLDSTGVDQGRA